MRYVSTRGGMQPAAFTDILLEGLAPDGGLAVPETYPRVDRATLAAWRPLGYRALALEILARYVDDVPRESLEGIVERTYTAEASARKRSPRSARWSPAAPARLDGRRSLSKTSRCSCSETCSSTCSRAAARR
jgi:threonine synthase